MVMHNLERVMKMHEMRQILDRIPGGFAAFRKNPRTHLIRLNAYIDELEANQRKRKPKLEEVSNG
jgi:hypothetical protein